MKRGNKGDHDRRGEDSKRKRKNEVKVRKGNNKEIEIQKKVDIVF